LWNTITNSLKDYPERLAVAKILVKNGLAVLDGKILCGKLKISTIEVSRAAGVDRRTVAKTIKTIEEHPELKIIFANIKPAGPSLKEIARHLKLGVLEITPVDATIPGILSASSSLLAERNISIRQAIVDDPELSPAPKLILIAERKISGDLISELLKVKGVSTVSIY
jgi:predicted regulator of amino acid metabolism with ACT domain